MVREASTLAVDGRHSAKGRGAYVHPKPECVAGFADRRGAIRSLRWTPPSGERGRVAEALRGLCAPHVR